MDIIVSLLQTLGSFLVAIFILVTIHEYGHFYAARKLGFKVEKLSIGFGKALFSWKSKDGEVEYVIAAIPLGGYVKMLGESSGESLKNQQDNNHLPSEEKSRSYELMPIWKRSVVALAGPVFNIVSAIILFMVIGWIGSDVKSPVVGFVDKGSVADKIGLKEGYRILNIGEKNIYSWSYMEETLRKYVPHDGISKPVTIAYLNNEHKTVVKKVNLSTTESDPMLSDCAFESLGISKKSKFFIDHVSENSPASMAGIVKGEILSVNGDKPISSYSIVSKIHNNTGKSISFTIKTKDKKDTFKVDVPKDSPLIGIDILTKTTTPSYRYRLGFKDGFVFGFTRTYDMTVMVMQSIGKLISGNISTEYISGPIAIAQISERSMESGFVSFLVFLAVISLNLGIMNLLPVPVLDGGHLIFLAIEKVKGCHIEPVVLEKVQYIGLILILGLMFFAIYNDLVVISS